MRETEFMKRPERPSRAGKVSPSPTVVSPRRVPSLAFGALCEKLADQLSKQGFTVSDSDELARVQLIADAVATVAVHGFMPRSQSDRARSKLAKRVWNLCGPSPAEAA